MAHPIVNEKNINAVREFAALTQVKVQEQEALLQKQSLAISALTTRLDALQTEVAFLRVSV